MLRRLAVLLAVLPALATAQPALDTLQTRAERSGFRQTSTYADVQAFVETLAAHSPHIHLTTFGETAEGRVLPLAVVGAAGGTPQAVRATGKARVLVVANIHAGEVAGKEAALALLRELARGAHADWTDRLTLLVAPVYNADGNEQVGARNRPFQHGPVEGMGQRPNAQGLDLNRDLMKLDAPESRALVALMHAYDPDLVLDLHTTNGTAHAYHVTYAPPLHPATPRATDAFLRERFLPAVTDTLATGGLLAWHYGNLPGVWGEPVGDRAGWYSFSPEPRFLTNYVGLRGRAAVLAEVYSYLPFEGRVRAMETFVSAVLDEAARHADDLQALSRRADAQTIARAVVPVQADFAPGEAHPVLLGEVAEEPNPVTGEPMRRRLDVVEATPMPAFVAYEGTLGVRAPAVYLVAACQTAVIERLRAHGISMEVAGVEADGARTLLVRAVGVGETYQNRQPLMIEAGEETAFVPSAPVVRVPTDGPLGRLAVLLLDPRSSDGFAAWGVVEGVEAGQPFPIGWVP